MKSKTINTELIDRAIAFAVKAHEGIARKGTNVPYIVHPMEAMTIVSTITDSEVNGLAHDESWQQRKQAAISRLAQALSPLAATPAYQEFTALIRQTFGE